MKRIVALVCVTGLALAACTDADRNLGQARQALLDLDPGEWYEFPDSVLVASPVAYTTDEDSEGSLNTNARVAGTMNAWCGGAYDTRRGRLLSHGGGHWWYAGNEMYAFRLDTGVWEVAMTRSATEDLIRCQPIQLDGRPSSAHVYNRVVYHPGWDAFVRMTGSDYCPNAHGGPYHWIGGLGPESAVPEDTWKAHYYGDDAVVPDAAHETAGLYDPVRDKLYMRGHGWFEVTYEIPCDKTFSDWLADPTDACGVEFVKILHESRYSARNTLIVRGRYIVSIGVKDSIDPQPDGVGDPIWVFDLDDGWAKTEHDTTGEKAGGPDEFQNPGLVYDPENDLIVSWVGGPDVYTLDPDTLLTGDGVGVWVKLTYTGPVQVPPNDSSGGVYTRMQYAPAYEGFVVAPGEDSPVYFFKLSAGGTGVDGGPPRDAGHDAGLMDAGSEDAGEDDAGTGDNPPDAGEADAGADDTPPADPGGADEGGTEDNGSGGCSCSTRYPRYRWLGLVLLAVASLRRLRKT